MQVSKKIERDTWVEKIRAAVLSAIDANVAEQLEIEDDGRMFFIVKDEDLNILFPAIDRLADVLAKRINNPESTIRNSAFVSIAEE